MFMKKTLYFIRWLYEVVFLFYLLCWLSASTCLVDFNLSVRLHMFRLRDMFVVIVKTILYCSW